MSLPSSLSLVCSVSHVVMLLVVVAQHDEVLCVLLRQPVLRSDDMKGNSSDALFDKEV